MGGFSVGKLWVFGLYRWNNGAAKEPRWGDKRGLWLAGMVTAQIHDSEKRVFELVGR